MALDPGAADAIILSRIAAGDERAVELLYDRYAARLYTLALHVCRDPGAAEEVVQDVFVAVWREAGRYDPRRGSVSTWLFGMARNRAVDELRRRGRRPSAPWEHVAEQPAPGPDAAASAEDRVLAEQARRLIGQMPAIYRTTLQLAYFQGLTQREIAQTMGVPLGTVKTRTRAGLEYLRRALEGGARAWGGT